MNAADQPDQHTAMLVDIITVRERINSLREAVELRFTLAQQALELQAAEYSKHLERLNGEAGRLRSMQETYLPRETYNTEHRTLTGRVDSLESTRDTATGRNSVIAAVVAAVISVSVIMVNYFLVSTKQ